MSEASAAGVSRASMDIDGQRSDGGGTASHAHARTGITREAQRKTAGPVATAWYAAQNPAINIEKTFLNIDRVNDGAGGFRETASIDEVVEYGDERELRVRRGVKEGERFALTTVHQLPWAYVRPDGTTYQPVDRDGVPRVDAAGAPVMLPRYEIIPERRDEAMKYFEDCLAFDASLLPDGQAAIHGYSINLDESRPHLQVLSDAYYEAPTQKDAEKMENGYSRAFGGHRSDRMVQATDHKTGKAMVNRDGSPKMVREGASRKFERYHAEFKSYMVERGHEVELERDEARHNRKLNLEDFKDLANEQAVLAAAEEEIDTAFLEIAAADADIEVRSAIAEHVLVEAVATGEQRELEAELVAAALTAEVRAEGEELAAKRAALDAERAVLDGQVATLAADRQAVGIELARLRRRETSVSEREADADDRDESLDQQFADLSKQQAALDAVRTALDEREREQAEKEEAFEKRVEDAVASARESCDAATTSLEEQRRKYADAAASIEAAEIPDKALPHMREKVLEKLTMTYKGEKISVADAATRMARTNLMKEYGINADPSALELSRETVREREREASSSVASTFSNRYGQSQTNRSSQGQGPAR